MEPNFPAFVTARPTFSPSAFVEAVVAAVLPLVDPVKGTSLREGRTPADVRNVLLQIFGRYTVEDAVYVHQMLYNTDGHWTNTDGGDDPRAHAVFEARELLVHFICHAGSSGPACAAARATFAARRDGDGDELSDELYDSLHFRISTDISHLRTGRFYGERFEGDHWASDLGRS
jgi:hypothetical protein